MSDSNDSNLRSRHGNSGPRKPGQLPRGPHHLSRDEVEANWLGRITNAVAAVVTDRGYAATTVEAISATANLSRRTFYDHYRNKQEAYLASYDTLTNSMFEQVSPLFVAEHELIPAMEAGIRKCLELMADHPDHAYMLIVDVLAAGPAAIRRRTELLQLLADLIAGGGERLHANLSPESPLPPEITAELIVGGTCELVYSRLIRGRADEIPALLPDIMYMVVLYYLGHDAACEELASLLARAEPARPAADKT